MEKKPRKTLSETIIDSWKKVDEQLARPTVIDMRPFIGKNRGKYS